MNKVIKTLHKDVEDSVSEFEGLSKKFSWGGVSHATWGDYLYWVNWQMYSINRALGLLNTHDYRNSFILIRVVFESYFVINLAINGKYYYQKIRPKRGESLSTSFDRVKKEVQQKNIKHVVKISKETNEKRIYVWRKGLYDQKKKTLTPYFYFLMREFDPMTAYLSSDIYLDSYKVSKDYRRRLKKEHSEIKNYFLNFTSSTIKLLSANKIITKKRQEKAIRVHYNFLSMFIHPNNKNFDILSINRMNPYIDKFKELNRFSDLLHHLALLYSGFLSNMYLEMIVNFFGSKGLIDKSDTMQRIYKFYGKYEYFWFIFNKPCRWDKYQRAMQLISRNKPSNINRFKNWENTIKDWTIPYYKNPAERLKNLSSGWTNSILGQYIPPKIV